MDSSLQVASDSSSRTFFMGDRHMETGFELSENHWMKDVDSQDKEGRPST